MQVQLLISGIDLEDYPIVLAKISEAKAVLAEVALPPATVVETAVETVRRNKKQPAPKSTPDPEPEIIAQIPEAPAATLEQAKAILDRVLKEKGMDAAKGLLAKFNAAGLKSLKAEKFADFIREGTEALDADQA